MNQDRQRKIMAQSLYKKPESAYEEIDLGKTTNVPKGCTKAFKNNRYFITIYDKQETSKGEAIRCMVQKIDNTPIINHWSELQKIKNTFFGEEVTAIEYYPKQSELVNTHNIYWLWVFENDILPIPIR